MAELATNSVTEVLAVVLRLVKLQVTSLSSPVVPSGRAKLTVTWLWGLSLSGSLQPVATMPIPASRNRLNLVKTFIFVKCLVINDLLFCCLSAIESSVGSSFASFSIRSTGEPLFAASFASCWNYGGFVRCR